MLQPRLFDDLPPTREETPVHQLNYPTFAGAENTMWHGRHLYPPKAGVVRGGWDPERGDPVHVGTFEAAAHRGLGPHVARKSTRDPGGRYTQPSDGYRPRTELVEAAGAEKGTQLLPFRVRDERMANDPEDPVSDSHANIAAGADPESGEYYEKFAEEMLTSGTLTAAEAADIEEGYGAYAAHLPDDLRTTGGLYYQNEHEDPGSISAVVPSAADLQHWPTEVLRHSDDPAKRRTAEFLRGRGY